VSEPAAAPELSVLPGVGPKRVELFERYGIRTLFDLVALVPRELEEMPHALPIVAARAARGELVRVAGEVSSFRLFRQGPRRSSLRATIVDATGQLDALFFNQPWLRDVLAKGRAVELVGQVVTTSSGPALRRSRCRRPGTSSRSIR